MSLCCIVDDDMPSSDRPPHRSQDLLLRWEKKKNLERKMSKLSFQVLNVTNAMRQKQSIGPMDKVRAHNLVCDMWDCVETLAPAASSVDRAGDPNIELFRFELGSLVVAADTLAEKLGLSLGECVAFAFNQKSDALKSDEKLST